MSAAVARQQQQSGHGANSNTGSRMGTNSPVEKRVAIKAEGTLAIILPPCSLYTTYCIAFGNLMLSFGNVTATITFHHHQINDQHLTGDC